MQRSATPERPNRVEETVLHALAWEILPEAPGLDAQVHDLKVARRSDSGSGYFAQFVTPRTNSRDRGLTGLYGTVHAMLDGLPQAVGFQLQLRTGRIVGLIADAYGQPIGAADIAHARVQQLFYLDTEGVSRAVPARQQPEPERRRRDAPAAPPVAASIVAAAQRMNGVPENLRQVIADAAPAVANAFETAAPTPSAARTRLWLWAAAAALALILVGIGMPWIFAIGIAFFVGRTLTQKKISDRITAATRERRWGA